MNVDQKSVLKGSTEIERQILNAVAEIQYGSVEIVIHDGKVVQIESREKKRIEGHSSSSR